MLFSQGINKKAQSKGQRSETWRRQVGDLPLGRDKVRIGSRDLQVTGVFYNRREPVVITFRSRSGHVWS